MSALENNLDMFHHVYQDNCYNDVKMLEILLQQNGSIWHNSA
jgi:hypothetical protein